MSDTPVSENPVVEEKVEELPPEPIKKPKKSSKKKEVPVPVPVVEEEEEEEEAPPTLIIHKRHKKSKPRKIIVITDDNSEPNSEDEEIPYRKRQEVVMKSKPAVKPVKVVREEKPAKATKPKFIPEAVEEEEDNVVINKPAPPKKPINVGHEGKIVGGKPSAPMTRAYLNTTQAQVEIAKKQTVTGDEWLDKLFNL